MSESKKKDLRNKKNKKVPRWNSNPPPMNFPSKNIKNTNPMPGTEPAPFRLETGALTTAPPIDESMCSASLTITYYGKI